MNVKLDTFGSAFDLVNQSLANVVVGERLNEITL